MAKTSSYHLKTPPKLFVPPPLFVGVKLHVPTPPPPALSFCSPPLPVISDQSLKGQFHAVTKYAYLIRATD